ncbi:hypothetical protein [Marisediminicola sp. LYQ134]|uniref:hypothetical protein n=1 Tax=unclassified Marisediminicola TaxID=2618316 RepID=UPI00398300DA
MNDRHDPREASPHDSRGTPWRLVGMVALAVGLLGLATSWSTISADWTGEGVPYLVINGLLIGAGVACLVASLRRTG